VVRRDDTARAAQALSATAVVQVATRVFYFTCLDALIWVMSARAAPRSWPRSWSTQPHVEGVLFEEDDLPFELVDVVGWAEAGFAPGLLAEHLGELPFELLDAGGQAGAALLGLEDVSVQGRLAEAGPVLGAPCGWAGGRGPVHPSLGRRRTPGRPGRARGTSVGRRS
jgi:hypothetical protein